MKYKEHHNLAFHFETEDCKHITLLNIYLQTLKFLQRCPAENSVPIYE
jgi:hypothetical protein